MLKNKYNVKIVSKTKIISLNLELDKTLNLAKNIYDDKYVFIAFKKEKQNNDNFWENELIEKLFKRENIYFTSFNFLRKLTIKSAFYSVRIVNEILNKNNHVSKKGLFLVDGGFEKNKQQFVNPKEDNLKENIIGLDDIENNKEITEENSYPQELVFSFDHAKKKEDIKDVLNKKQVYSKLDSKDERETKYTKEEFMDKLEHFKLLNDTIYKMLVKTFETINGMENKDGYFKVPVGIVPRPQGDMGIFDENEDTYFFTVIDDTGMAIYQDSIKINKDLLVVQEIYESIGYMILILINGFKVIDNKPVDKLCKALDIPLYYNKEKNLFYKKYIEKIIDN